MEMYRYKHQTPGFGIFVVAVTETREEAHSRISHWLLWNLPAFGLPAITISLEAVEVAREPGTEPTCGVIIVGTTPITQASKPSAN